LVALLASLGPEEVIVGGVLTWIERSSTKTVRTWAFAAMVLHPMRDTWTAPKREMSLRASGLPSSHFTNFRANSSENVA
jgi:hypothetical protein